MTSLHVRVPIRQGFTPLLKSPQSGMRWLNFGVLRLSRGETYTFPPLADRETGLVLLGGTADVEGETFHWRSLGERENVFDGRATAIYLPPGVGYTVRALTDLEAAVITAPASKGAPPTVIRPQDVIVHERRGKPTFLRDVHDIIVDQVPADMLLVGETFNYPGEWSSYPPHKHDVHRPPEEVELEEVYFYKIDPPQGFGLQRIYAPDRGFDETYLVLNDDLVLIPWGYHPVAAAPGYRLYYLWALAGKARVIQPYVDPEHAWIMEGR